MMCVRVFWLQYMYNALSENNCSENASRMQAMENSTKNASEMLEKLTLSYNRWVPGAGLALLRGWQLAVIS